MANDYVAISDFVADALDVARTATSDLLLAAPTVARMPRIAPADGGTVHKYNKYTGKPTVGFRSENDGRENDHSEDTVVSVNLKICDFSFAVDMAVADGWRDGGAQAFIAREGRRHLEAMLFKLEQQLFYGTGTGGDAAGFSGFLNSTYLDALADGMVVDAGGTTAATASSVYGIRLSTDDVAMVTKDTIDFGETTIQRVAGSTGFYPAYWTPASVWVGLQMGGAYSVGRIANLTADSGKGLTDDLISEMLNEFPANMGPSILVMNRRSLRQLQQSRTATNSTGAPAPFPTEAFGVPIIVTDALLSTEALET
jgi:hypothetical protein